MRARIALVAGSEVGWELGLGIGLVKGGLVGGQDVEIERRSVRWVEFFG